MTLGFDKTHSRAGEEKLEKDGMVLDKVEKIMPQWEVNWEKHVAALGVWEEYTWTPADDMILTIFRYGPLLRNGDAETV